jgi:AraC family transcriptional regulator
MNESGEFEYIASVEVSRLDEVPKGMVGRTIPQQKYAVFAHKGKTDRIKETYKYIYGTWQPKSNCELVKAPDFEYYDERFDANNQEDSEMDIYIPIK